MRLLLKIIKAACGLFVAYIAIGCAVGFALPSPHGEGCFPFGATFGVLLTRCSNAAADMFWSVLVGWPRFVIVFPAAAFALLKAAASAAFRHWWSPSPYPSLALPWLSESVVWLLYSIPLALVMWVSFAYWKARSRPMAIGLTVVVFAEILYLGSLG
jgi:hypothetical protein